MDSHIDNLYQNIDQWIPPGTVDFSRFGFVHPWDIGLMSLLAIKHHAEVGGTSIGLPQSKDVLGYLKRMHLPGFLEEVGYRNVAAAFRDIPLIERENVGLQEILHCYRHDDFNGRLGHLGQMFRGFGLNEEDANRALVIVGELGDNVFDHNLGNWPTEFNGSIIAAQNYPKLRRIEMIVADAGVGFRGSLRERFPELQSDVEAIQKGLAGYTGRIGESRGNGLKTIQDWTIKNFHGILTIHSGNGLVQVDEHGLEAKEVVPILGTLAQFVIYYE